MCGPSLVVVHSLLIAVASLVMELGFCGMQASVAAAGGLSSCGSQALEHENSVFVAQGLSFPVVCGIFPEQASNNCPLHWPTDS